MTDNLLIHADSHRDADMFVATGVAVADPFTYLELDGQRVIVASVLEADVIRRDSRASDVWTDDQFGGRELMAKGWSYHDAEMEIVRRVLEKAGAQAVIVPPPFPVSLADYLRGKGHTVTPDRDLFERRRRSKDAAQLAAINVAQRATEQAFRSGRGLLGAATPKEAGVLMAGGATPGGWGGVRADGGQVTCERVRDAIVDTLREHGCEGEPPLVGAGPRGALVHDLGSGPIHAGEPGSVAIFPRPTASRYCADMTRTFCFGEAPERLSVMHATVLDALRRSTAAITDGVAGTVPWEVACDAIEAGGFRTQRGLADGESLSEDFFHGLGHGVGIEVHEAPYMGLGCKEPLAAGG